MAKVSQEQKCTVTTNRSRDEADLEEKVIQQRNAHRACGKLVTKVINCLRSTDQEEDV